MDEIQIDPITGTVIVAGFVTVALIVLPFVPPHIGPIAGVAIAMVGFFWIFGIPAIRSLFPDREEFDPEPEQTREEKLKQQYVDGELSEDEFEDKLDRVMDMEDDG